MPGIRLSVAKRKDLKLLAEQCQCTVPRVCTSWASRLRASLRTDAPLASPDASPRVSCRGQAYKEGKFILEEALIVRSGWSL